MEDQGSWKVRAGRMVVDERGNVVATAGAVLPYDDENANAPRNRGAVVRVFGEPPTQNRQMAEDRNVAFGEMRRSSVETVALEAEASDDEE